MAAAAMSRVMAASAGARPDGRADALCMSRSPDKQALDARDARLVATDRAWRRPEASSPGHRRCDPALAQRLKRELEGEVLFDAFDRGRYSDRRLDLPDRAASASSCRRTDADVAGGARDRARGRRAGAAARRRHLAVRPDRRRRRWSSTTPSIWTEVRRARRRARARVSVEPGVVLDRLNALAQAARPVVSGRCLDQQREPRSAAWRRTTLRRALDPLRQHGRTTCSRSTRCSPTASAVRFGEVPGNLGSIGASAALSRADPDHARDRRRARPTRSTRASRKCCAGSAATTSIASMPAGHNMAHLLVGSEGTLALFRAPAARSCSRCRGTGRSASAISRPSIRRWTSTQHIVELGPVGGRAGRSHDDRAGARDPGVPAGDRALRARRARRYPAGRVRRRRAGRADRAAASACAS